MPISAMRQANAAPDAPAPITSTPTGSFIVATAYKRTSTANNAAGCIAGLPGCWNHGGV